MKQVVVADTGPLIILAGIDRLSLLFAMYGTVIIPEAVHAELKLSLASRTGKPSQQSELSVLQQVVDPGEAEAFFSRKVLPANFF